MEWRGMRDKTRQQKGRVALAQKGGPSATALQGAGAGEIRDAAAGRPNGWGRPKRRLEKGEATGASRIRIPCQKEDWPACHVWR